MSEAKEFMDHNKHIFDMANNLRHDKTKAHEADMIFYLLHQVLDKCKIIDEKNHEIKKLKGKKDVN